MAISVGLSTILLALTLALFLPVARSNAVHRHRPLPKNGGGGGANNIQAALQAKIQQTAAVVESIKRGDLKRMSKKRRRRARKKIRKLLAFWKKVKQHAATNPQPIPSPNGLGGSGTTTQTASETNRGPSAPPVTASGGGWSSPTSTGSVRSQPAGTGKAPDSDKEAKTAAATGPAAEKPEESKPKQAKSKPKEGVKQEAETAKEKIVELKKADERIKTAEKRSYSQVAQQKETKNAPTSPATAQESSKRDKQQRPKPQVAQQKDAKKAPTPLATAQEPPKQQRPKPQRETQPSPPTSPASPKKPENHDPTTKTAFQPKHGACIDNSSPEFLHQALFAYNTSTRLSRRPFGWDPNYKVEFDEDLLRERNSDHPESIKHRADLGVVCLVEEAKGSMVEKLFRVSAPLQAAAIKATQPMGNEERDKRVPRIHEQIQCASHREAAFKKWDWGGFNRGRNIYIESGSQLLVEPANCATIYKGGIF